MKQSKTATELLAQIEEGFFKGARLAEACMLKGDERRAFRLAQVERLLTEHDNFLPRAILLSDMFWTADEGRVLTGPAHPLLSLKGQQTLTDEEMTRLRLIVEVAGLCHDLGLHFTFDLKEALGIRRNDFGVSNRPLVEWLTTTPYERIAMHTAYTMKRHAIGVYVGLHYQPAQDELAELFSAEHGDLVRQPETTRIPPRAYVRTILDALLAIERHWQRGRRLKLSPDVVMLHDEICGVVPRRFDKGVLEAAQALCDYMESEVDGRLKGADKETAAEVLRRFADKVHEVRPRYLAEGWLTDDSLAFAYLLAHAERCGQGC